MKRIVVITFVVVVLAACGASHQLQRSSNLLSYLYPGSNQMPTPQHPVLPIPLRVGVAFLPAEQDGIDDLQQSLILHDMKTQFEQEQGVAKVTVIPSTYLRGKSGFDHLTQLAKLYNVDVIALISYEQLAMASERKSSFLYWTLIGAYGIKGTRNDVHTYLDAAVIDIASHSLLFRADGIDARTANSNMVESDLTQRQLFDQSLQAASKNLAENLHVSLQLFKDDVKQDQVATFKPRYAATSHSGGGGSFSGGVALLLLLIWAGKRVRTVCERLPNEPR